ncbi:hypothetical protein Pcinc_002893 [Petrolisthes cinctipes]|uniref:Uncharacterized protein n=1 Tax=Petrolisthes cinctipes TaxID=88211 RepID=A0AAE1GHV8_PETCI|nr:hypothetical protein Pcinc_002893 [Petrolisthes cinctipes]
MEVSTDSPLPHAGDEEVTGGGVGEREGEVVGDTTPTYGAPVQRQQEDYRKQQEEQRRQQEEHRRQQEEEFRRQQEEHRRELEEAKLTALLQALSQLSPTHTSSPGALPTLASQGTPASSSSSAPLPPLPQKAITQNPPPLHADVTFQVFREWCRRVKTML